MNMANEDNQSVNAKVRDLLKEAKELNDSIYLDDTGESRRSLRSQFVGSIDVYDGNDFVDSSGNYSCGRIASSAVCAADSAMSVELNRLATYKNRPYSMSWNDTGECDRILRLQNVGSIDVCDENNCVDSSRVNYCDGRIASSAVCVADSAMFVESNRLATYTKWPDSAPINSLVFARAGFFYTGKDDMVECFACMGKIKDWELGDSAMGEHKQHFPRCKFVLEQDKLNQSLVKDCVSATTDKRKSIEDDLYKPNQAASIDIAKAPKK